MARERTVAVTFIPEYEEDRVRTVGRVAPGDTRSWQYFDVERGSRDERGFREKPTGRELWIEHQRFAARAIISRSLLVDPNKTGKPELEKLFELTPEEPSYELRVRTAVDEVGVYAVRFTDL